MATPIFLITDIPILTNISIVFALAIPIIFLCSKIHISSLVALLLTGVLAGPEVLGVISSHKSVEQLAEIGVVLLLFTIGVEFSLKELWKMKFMVLVGGSLQLLLTIFGAVLALYLLNYSLKTAIFFGCLIVPSSTAIVLKILQEKAQISAPNGRLSLAILIFQDIAIIPLMLLLPIVAGNTENMGNTLLLLILKGIAIIILTLVCAVWVVPKFLEKIVKTRNQELFLLCVVAIVVSIAIITLKMGLSLGLGAFLAGLIISESRYSYQALAGILPFKQTFLPFFFISIGMLLDINFFVNHFALVLIMTVCVLLWKFFVIFCIALILKLSVYEAFLAGIAICQVGEFAFVLITAGASSGLSLENIYQPFLAVSIMTMGLTPFLISLSPKIAEIFAKIPWVKKWQKRQHDLIKETPVDKKDHIVIVGYGIGGRNVAHAARAGNIPYVIIELNPITVKEEAEKGEPIYYGNAIHTSILEHAKIDKARILVVTIPNSLSARKIVNIAKNANPNLYIIARTRFVREMEYLYKCGADIVVPEEFETSVEIFTHILKKYLVAENKIREFTQQIRSNNYQILRETKIDKTEWQDLKLNIPDIEITTFYITKGHQDIVNKKLADLRLNKKFGVAVLAIRRDGQIIMDIDGESEILPEDNLISLGKAENLAKFANFYFA